MCEKFKAFLKRKDIEVSVKRYEIDALGAPFVLFSLITVGFASNELGDAGGLLAVCFVAIIVAEAGKMISKETKVDILVTPLVTVGVGIGVAALIAPALEKAAMKIDELIMLATNLQPFLMGIAVSVLVGISLILPISSAAICSAFGLTGLASGVAVAGCCAQMRNIIKNPRIWIAPIVTSAIIGFDWAGMILISFVLLAVIWPLINMRLKKIRWVKDGAMILS